MKKLIKTAQAIFIFQIIVLLLFNFQCGNRSDLKPLNEKLFVQVYCDVVVYADLVDANKRTAFVDSVLMSYKINREQFQNTVNIYSSDDKKWEKVFARIVAELERREKELGAKADSVKGERE